MTKHKYSRWTLLAAASLCLTLGITSCKDNDDAYTKPEYSITAPKAQNKTFALPEAGGTASLQLTSNRSWKAVTTADWINISPSAGGAGSAEIKIQVLPNTGANRSAQVALQLGGKSELYTITQTGSGTSSEAIKSDAEGLAAFIKKYDTGSEVTVSEDVSLKAALVSDIEANNLTNNRNIVLQAGTQGITVRLAKPANKAWKPGTVFVVKAKGGKVQRFNGGSLQLDLSAVTDASAVSASESLETVEPIKLSLSDIYSGKYDNILVAVDGVQFAATGKTLNPNKPSGTRAPASYYHRLSDCVTELPQAVDGLSVAISGYAPEALRSQVSPEGNGRVVGILQINTLKSQTPAEQPKKAYNLWPRTAADLSGLTGKRCSESSSQPKPTPTPDPGQGTQQALSLKDFIAKYPASNTKHQITEDISFEATLITQLSEGNSTALNLTLQSGDQGIIVRLGKDLPASLKAGTVYKVKAKGAGIGLYNGSLQLEFAKDTGAEAVLEDTGRTQQIRPKRLTLAEVYAGTYDNILVELSGVQFSQHGKALNPNKPSSKGSIPSYFATRIEDCATSLPAGISGLSLAISGKASFKGETTSDKAGTIIGILSRSFRTTKTGEVKEFNLWPRSLSDIRFDAQRCTK